MSVTFSNNGETVTFSGSGTLTGATAQIDQATTAIIQGYTSIGFSAFQDASNLTSITISASVTSIGHSAFSGNVNLTSVIFEAGSLLTNIGENAFIDVKISSITIPESVTIIGMNAFFRAYELTSVLFEGVSQLTTLDTSAFHHTHKLTSIILPDSLISIGNLAFRDSPLSETFTIPPNVTSIGTLAFGEVEVRPSNLQIVYIANNQLTGIASPASNVSFFGVTVTTVLPGGLYDPNSGLLDPVVPGDVPGGSGDAGAGVPAVPICFPAGTPVMTNKGEVAIEKLNPDVHKIRGKRIVAITETSPTFKYIIRIEKDALGPNIPSRRTEISRDHEVFYKGKMMRSEDLVDKCEGVCRIKYHGETLYNVLMEKHDNMMINNLICETLHPNNIMAKICGGKYTTQEKKKLYNELNNILAKNDISGCKKLYKYLCK